MVVGLAVGGMNCDSAARRESTGPGFGKRDGFIEQFAATRGFSLGRPVSVTATPQGDAVLFLRSVNSRSFVQDLWIFDVATRRERVLLTAEQILGGEKEKLTPEELARRERMRSSSRGISGYELSKDGNRLLVPLSGRLFVIDLTRRDSPVVKELKSTGGIPLDARFTPDGQKVVSVRGGDIFAMDVATGVEAKLTSGATEAVTHGLAEFVAQEEMGRFAGYWVSPDSKKVAYQRTDTSKVEMFAIADAANPGKPVQRWAYPRAGKANADVTLGVMPIGGGETTWIQWNREKYPYLVRVDWAENAPLVMLVENREQTETVMLRVEVDTGKTAEMFSETDPAWINVPGEAGMGRPVWLRDGSGFLWSTEQGASGKKDRARLELRDREGKLLRTLVDGSRNCSVVGQEQGKDSVILSISDDYRANEIWQYPLRGQGKPELLLSAVDLKNHGVGLSRDSDLWVRYESDDTGKPLVQIRRGPAGELFGELRSVAEEPAMQVRREYTTAKVDGRELNAVLIRPRTFAAARKYPVIDHVYGGPGSTVVGAGSRGYLLDQWVADQGYIVVCLDARGTPGRGRAWERVTKGDVIEVPLREHAAGMQALTAKYKEMDGERIGIMGWSFGGYFSAIAAERRPDVYKAAVAVAPVVDWRDYDTFYTERYMGTPESNPKGYEAANVLTYAKDLRVPLLIMHGTADDNVYTFNSLKLVDALFRNEKRFEFVPLAGFTHAVNEPEAKARLWARVVEFFGRELK